MPNFFKYSTNPHGTRVIQKILDLLTENNQIKSDLFFEEVRKYSLDLLRDFNGIHVIQKIVTTIPSLKIFVYEILQENMVAIATNKHGCCALQKCLELADRVHKESLIDAIIKNSIILMTDQFGNYVIQFVISSKDQTIISRIINSFKNNIEYLSKQKFASNVIEKVIVHFKIFTNYLKKFLNLAKPMIFNLNFNLFKNSVLIHAQKKINSA